MEKFPYNTIPLSIDQIRYCCEERFVCKMIEIDPILDLNTLKYF